jgi:hypothetical protein
MTSVGKKRSRQLPPGYRYKPVGGFHYETGAAFGAGFWAVIAIPFLIIGRSTHGTVSDVLYGVAAFFGLLAAINFAFYATGHNGGTAGKWKTIDPPSPDDPPASG